MGLILSLAFLSVFAGAIALLLLVGKAATTLARNDPLCSALHNGSVLASVEVNFQTFSEIVIRCHATPAVFVKALVFSGVMGLIGGLVPAICASRASPVEAMRA